VSVVSAGGAASAVSAAPARVVVMGVSGCGKTTVGHALAQALGWRFIEGDALHPAANVARMAAGIALTDEDRRGWLDAVGRELAEAAARHEGVVASCSALKRRYRDQLRAAEPRLRFVHLHGPREVIEARLALRSGHYMPASLLQSQFDALEPPAEDEGEAKSKSKDQSTGKTVLRLELTAPPAQLVEAAARWLQASS
jgi:gluconokinase